MIDNTRTKRICIRLTDEEFDSLQLLADKLKHSWQKKGNVGHQVRMLIRQRIADFDRQCKEQTESIAKAKAEGRKLLGTAGRLSDKNR